MNDQQLDQLLNALPQPEPSATLDSRITGAVEKLLVLENFHRAHLLLASESARLDETTKANLLAAMSEQRKIYGADFDVAYSNFLAQQSASQSENAPSGQEPERR